MKDATFGFAYIQTLLKCCFGLITELWNIVQDFVNFSTKRKKMILGLYKNKFSKFHEYRILVYNNSEEAIIICAKPHTFPADVAQIRVENISKIYHNILI